MSKEELPSEPKAEIFVPVGKGDEAELQRTLEAIDLYKQGNQADASSFVEAFSSDTDVYHVQTGNASVTEADSIRNLLSTPPELPKEESEAPLLVALGLAIKFLFF